MKPIANEQPTDHASDHADLETLFVAVCAETQSVCNRRCWFCKFGQPRERIVREEMTWETIERIIDNLKDLDYRGRVSWFKTNEPLLDRRIFDIIQRTKSKLPDCCCSLLTNGDLLNDVVLVRLEQAGLDRLGISVYDDQTLGRVSSLGSTRLTVAIFDHRPAQERMFVESRGGNIELLEPSVAAVRRDMTDKDCQRPSTMMNILPDGSVVLCCADYYGDVVMGNVREQTLEQIWFGPGFHQYRRQLQERGRRGLKLCEGCTCDGVGHSRDYP